MILDSKGTLDFIQEKLGEGFFVKDVAQLLQVEGCNILTASVSFEELGFVTDITQVGFEPAKLVISKETVPSEEFANLYEKLGNPDVSDEVVWDSRDNSDPFPVLAPLDKFYDVLVLGASDLEPVEVSAYDDGTLNRINVEDVDGFLWKGIFFNVRYSFFSLYDVDKDGVLVYNCVSEGLGCVYLVKVLRKFSDSTWHFGGRVDC